MSAVFSGHKTAMPRLCESDPCYPGSGETATPTRARVREHTHAEGDLLNPPGTVAAASEQASVTHCSKNKLGSCENKAWEPWVFRGVVREEGWDKHWWASSPAVGNANAE